MVNIVISVMGGVANVIAADGEAHVIFADFDTPSVGDAEESEVMEIPGSGSKAEIFCEQIHAFEPTLLQKVMAFHGKM